MALHAIPTTDPTHETIARRAYEIWESRGRPPGQDLAIWLDAERELIRTPQVPVEVMGNNEPLPLPGPEQDLHYIVLLDRGHLRVYAEDSPFGTSTPRYVPVESIDFAEGIQSYNQRDTDQAGRFPGSKGRDAAGMSIDERLPMQRERDHQLVRRMAARINELLEQHPHATWDYAAGPQLHRAVLEQINPAIRRRLRLAVQKDLVHQPLVRMHAHFTEQLQPAGR